jgi:FtsH-binding integral membrane protein
MKYVTPAIFALIGFILIGGYFILIAFAIESLIIRIVFGIISLIIFVCLIFVYMQRVKEMKEENKNDYSKY